MFPRGTPGIALLLLRASVLASVWIGEPGLPGSRPQDEVSLLAWLVLVGLSLLVGVGLLTPVAAILCVALNVEAIPINGVSAALSSVSLALIGPGGYSVDAWLFGRRVVVVAEASEAKRIAPT